LVRGCGSPRASHQETDRGGFTSSEDEAGGKPADDEGGDEVEGGAGEEDGVRAEELDQEQGEDDHAADLAYDEPGQHQGVGGGSTPGGRRLGLWRPRQGRKTWPMVAWTKTMP
jgi:hypothetical protein